MKAVSVTTPETLLLLIFTVILLSWAGVSGYVLLARALYEMRHRPLRALREQLRDLRAARVLLRDAAVEEVPPAERARQLERSLAGVSLRTIYRVAADTSVPPQEVEILAAYALRTWGVERLARDASAHRGVVRKWRRVAALRILAYVGYADILVLLERALRDRDPDVVGAAVSLLGRMKDLRAAELLIEALRTQAYVPSRIGSVLEQFPLAIPDLLRPLLTERDPVVRFWAATLAARYAGAEHLDAELAALVEDPDPRVRKAVVQTLAKLGGSHAASTARKLLDDPVWYVRAHAIQALGNLGRVDLTRLILPALADRQWWVRVAAKQALQALGPPVWRQVVPYLDHPDAFARDGAAEVLQNLGILDRLAGEAVTNELDSGTAGILRKALSTGGGRIMDALVERTGPEARPRMQQLLESLGLQAARNG